MKQNYVLLDSLHDLDEELLIAMTNGSRNLTNDQIKKLNQLGLVNLQEEPLKGMSKWSHMFFLASLFIAFITAVSTVWVDPIPTLLPSFLQLTGQDPITWGGAIAGLTTVLIFIGIANDDFSHTRTHRLTASLTIKGVYMRDALGFSDSIQFTGEEVGIPIFRKFKRIHNR